MNKFIALAGSGSVTEKNATTLLNDFIGTGSAVMYGPNYVTQEQESLREILGMYPYVKVRKGKLIDSIDGREDDAAFIVLGTEGLEDLIGQAQRSGIPVLDMCRGLFQITEPLDGIESHAEPLSEPSEGEDLQEEPDLVTDALSASDPWADEQPLTRKDVKEIVMAMIAVHERMYHNGVPVDDLPPARFVTANAEQAKPLDSEPNYYKSKTGKLRPMGRSKARPGEVPVYLTQEEIDGLRD